MTERPLPDWVTIRRAARELGVDPALIESNIRAGRIDAETRADERGKLRTVIPGREIEKLLRERVQRAAGTP